MINRRIILFICLFSLSLTLAAQEKLRVAVLPFGGKGVGEQEAEAITALFEGEITQTGAYTMIEQSQIEKVLEIQKEQGLTGCYDESCAVELGQLLAAEQIIIGTVTKLGDSYTVTAKLTDLALGMIIRSEKITSNNLEGLGTGLQELAALLTGTGRSKALETLEEIYQDMLAERVAPSLLTAEADSSMNNDSTSHEVQEKAKIYYYIGLYSEAIEEIEEEIISWKKYSAKMESKKKKWSITTLALGTVSAVSGALIPLFWDEYQEALYPDEISAAKAKHIASVASAGAFGGLGVTSLVMTLIQPSPARTQQLLEEMIDEQNQLIKEMEYLVENREKGIPSAWQPSFQKGDE